MVYNLQDIFPDSAINTGVIKNELIIQIARMLEKATYDGSKVITVIGEDFEKNIVAKGIGKEKIEIIPNWVDETKLNYVERQDNYLFDKYSIDRSKFILVYSGNFGLSQNFELVFKVAQELKEYSDIQFIIVGDGARKDELFSLKDELDLKNLQFLPFQSFEDVSKVYSLGDVGLVTLKPRVSTNSIPSKTWTIMAIKRPIIASIDLDSELVSLLKEESCGIGVDPTDSNQLREAILHLYKNREEATKLGENGREYIEEHLSRKVNTTKYNKLFKKILGQK